MKSNGKTISVDTKTIFTALVSALVVGAVTGAYGYSRIVDINTLTIESNTKAVEKLENTCVNKEVYTNDIIHLREYFEEKFNHLERLIQTR